MSKKMKRTYTGSTSVVTTRRTSDDSVTVYRDTYTDTETTFRKEQSGLFGILTSMTTYVIIFMLLLFGTSAIHYQNNQEDLSWIDANGQFKTSTYDVTVSYNLDTPLDELNGNSLNDVFDTNDLFTSFNVTHSSANYNINNDILTLTDNTNNFQWVSIFNYDGSASINHTFYCAVEFATNDTNSNNRRLRLFDDTTFVYATTTFLKQDINFEYFSVLGEKTLNDLDILVYNSIGSGFQNDDTLIRDVVLVDLTALGIDQTKDEMDYWFSEYQKLSQGNMLEDLKTLGAMPLASWSTMNEVTRTLIDIYEFGMKLVFPVVDVVKGLISLV